jgi:hypothetical protein
MRQLEELLRRSDVLADPKSDLGPLGLDTLLTELGRANHRAGAGLTGAAFAGISDRIVAAWRG